MKKSTTKRTLTNLAFALVWILAFVLTGIAISVFLAFVFAVMVIPVFYPSPAQAAEEERLSIATAKTPDSADIETVTAINGILNQFPQETLGQMMEDGWRVLVTDRQDWHVNYRDKLAELSAGQYESSTYYFLAAYLDEADGPLQWKSREESFTENIYRPEADAFYCRFQNLYDGSVYSRRAEYFANALCAYAEKNGDLKTYCPKTWQFVHDILDIPTDAVL